ncbi:hypothetical protein A9Q81_11885 [Gammaproteobacteria bacterium 42_54_T18]|nr:hypothetical protein A9Q81_11885 [Gammaproteobacteria bacterium 42_54_T18]
MSSELTVTNESMLQNNETLTQYIKVAEYMSTSKAMLPVHFHRNPGDCLALVMQASMWGMNPYLVGQKTHVVSGTLGYEAQLVNAVITTNAPITSRIKYNWFGDWHKVIGKFATKTNQTTKKQYKVPDWKPVDEEGLGVSVYATFKGDSEPTQLDLYLTQAQTRNSTLWASDPKQQLAYLAVKRWARLHCPEIMMGVYTEDELRDSPPSEKDITSEATVSSSPLGDLMQSEVVHENDEDKLMHHAKCMTEAKTKEELKVEFGIAWTWTKDNNLVEYKGHLEGKYKTLLAGFEPIEGEAVAQDQNSEAA